MDYSMLLGVESKVQVQVVTRKGSSFAFDTSVVESDLEGNNEEPARFNRHRFHRSDENQTYHISVIDYLQAWNTNKKMEQFLKVNFRRANKAKLSAIEPVGY